MHSPLSDEKLNEISPIGHHIALRIGFAFPMAEINEWPQPWIDHYTSQRFVMRDPAMRWVYSQTGAIRWGEIPDADPDQVLRQASAFGLRHGAAVSCKDEGRNPTRSFGMFARQDRPFHQGELAQLLDHVKALHAAKAPPKSLTAAELEALELVVVGLRQKEIAFRLGVSEGAIKQRLRNAKTKLGAATAPQAAAMAREFGLL